MVGVDITDRKNAELILIKSEIELKNLNAMKDKFFSIVAHDLKNPFNSILGLSNMLYEAYEDFDDVQRKEFLKNIVQSSENTFKLLQNLLEWSRTQTGKIEYSPSTIDISLLINENISIFSSAAKNKNIRILSFVPVNTRVFADENMIKTVIRNLLSNAIKFTKSSGKVEITALPFDNQMKVTISDTGVGIRPEDLERLFRIDDQYKTNGTFEEEGSGLGLILCKELVEKNGGKVWVESELNVGSKFNFSLPVASIG